MPDRPDNAALRGAENYREGSGDLCCGACVHSRDGYWCSQFSGRLVSFSETRPTMLCDSFAARGVEHSHA